MTIDFSGMDNEKLIDLVNQGIGSHQGLAGSMELQRRLNKSLSDSIHKLDENIKKQSRIETNLTRAMYILSGVAVLLTVVQILIAFFK